MCLPKSGLKAFALVLNVLLFLCGGILVGIGAWAISDKLFISDIAGSTLYSSAAYLLVVIGCFLVILSFLGCFGAITDSRIPLGIYVLAMIVIFILLMTAGILGAVFKDSLELDMKNRMFYTIREQYGYNTNMDNENAQITFSWDLTQSRLQCCAVDDQGWYIYRDSRWFLQQYNTYKKKFVPESCCVYAGNLRQFLNQDQCQSFTYGPPGNIGYGGAANPYLHYKGCYQAARDFVVSQSTIIIGVGFSFCVFLIAAIIINVLLVRSVAQGSRDFRERPEDYDHR